MTKFSAGIGSVRGGRDARAGMRSVIANYNKLIAHFEEVTPEILYDALYPTWIKSQEYCPVDTGALVDSGYLVLTASRGHPTVSMGYGFGGQPEYTVRVHENMEWRHEPPTRAKWLQVALEEDSGAIQARIISALREVIS